jgi:hypothetical protein
MYDLYGAEDRSVHELGRAVGAALGVQFALHDSDYMGGEYLLYTGAGGEKFIIQTNQIEDEDGAYMQEPDFPDCKTVLLVERTLQGDIYRAQLDSVSGLRFLRRQIS